MRRLRPALLLFLGFAVPASARHSLSLCGTTRETPRESMFLHRQALRARVSQLSPRLASGNRDIGNIAIIEDAGGVVARQNQFNLDLKTLEFAPATATSYRYSVLDGGYDACLLYTSGWNSPPLERLSADPAAMLQQLDEVWDRPSPAVRKQIEDAALSNDALLRQAAVEALGRLGNREAAYTLELGDTSKLVQRTAAWAMRQTYSRHPETAAGDLSAALSSPDDRVRWGATRVFANHFAALGGRPEVAAPLANLLNDQAEMVRMGAVKGLWQYWFWAPAAATKSLIEDRILLAMREPQTLRVEINLRAAVYNLADENIRYLYNNWVPLMGRPQDRERAINGRLAIEDRLATKFAAVLTTGSERQKKLLLESLTSLPLRRGDVYDLDADLEKSAPPAYNRIGNDIEQIEFFGKSGDLFAHALRPLLDSTDPMMQRLAGKASLLVRETRSRCV